MARRFSLLCFATICALAVPHVASATTDENILLLGVSRAGKHDQRLTKDLSDHLARSGEQVSPRPTLSTQDRSCTDQECLDQLASREKAQVVLTTQLQENGTDAYYVVMTLFDAVRHSPLTERNLCDQCTGETLTLKLSDTADKLLKRYRDRKSGVTTDTVGMVPTPPPGANLTGPADGPLVVPPVSDINKPKQGWMLSPKRKIIAGVLGGAAAAALATSIALTVINGSAASGTCSYMSQTPEERCVYNNTAGYAVGYAATAGLLIGVGLTLGLP